MILAGRAPSNTSTLMKFYSLLLYSLLFSFPFLYHPLPLPSYLHHTINLTHSLPAASNPSLANNCWLCISLSSSAYIAVPTLQTDRATSPVSLHLRTSFNSPHLYPPEELIYFLDRSSKTSPDISHQPAAALLHIYLKNLSPYINSTPPIFGPLTTQTTIPVAAPLCISRQRPTGIPLGNISPSRCSFTLHLQSPTTHVTETIGVFQLHIIDKPSINTDKLKNVSSNYCLGRHLPYISLHPWLPSPCSSDSPPRPSSCLLTPSPQNNSERLLVDTQRFLIHHENRTSSSMQLAHQSPLQPLTAAALAGSLGVWVQDTPFSTPSHPFSLHLQFCLTQGLFFLCGSSTYMCLPANWTGTCTLVFLTPKIQFANGTKELPVPLMTLTPQKRVIPLIPLMVGLGLSASTIALSTGIAGISTSVTTFRSPSNDFSASITDISQTLSVLQAQVDSLAAVVLQNRRGLGLSILLNEECCFYLNQSGLVYENIKKLKDRAQKLANQASNYAESPWALSNWMSWVLPILSPLIPIFLLLLFGPCIFHLVSQFIQNRIQAITNHSI
uniref:HERV-H_2q24.1 provirus ancestral Env polyprotein n=1 Tax=Homo sapiens TaxID=9606 RepID=ENH3_HUMAN|nr:RecName: Full=HERV-H_2q24.1 provirus ancestral Env polyprotein; AltName: Full=Env protein HERV-H/p59; AltName: Full=Envelope polyprotein; AltName: Full=HERV-H/env59; Contains: RecName: Full=Surface protein; Short=SU; Contains: RecName: Full=Transmembrane protein; Short=TM; Flags: Precursor [Homo sapiens]CAB94194.1 envelope protein [HERV-H/env59]